MFGVFYLIHIAFLAGILGCFYLLFSIFIIITIELGILGGRIWSLSVFCSSVLLFIVYVQTVHTVSPEVSHLKCQHPYIPFSGDGP